MRDVLTFTIDPADAKDFDDALSYQDNGDGTCQVGVHIADVSYYVQPGSVEDEDAYQRGTSTYLVDHVEPMLPEELCNGICSLRPDEEKLCMSVVFTMSPDAEVIKYKICRTVIRSDYRLCYEQAQELLGSEANGSTAGAISRADGSNSGSPAANSCASAIISLWSIAQKLRAQRMREGALDIEAEEVRFRLDEKGVPVDMYVKHPMEANWLIEEWMLLANRTVARHLYGKPTVWRVHDIPDSDKMRELGDFKRRMKGKVSQHVIDMLTVRAMAKAEYSTVNIGHYGLRFAHYTHFTSPIRRYPDLMVHRLVAHYILGERDKGHSGHIYDIDYLTEACKHCSEMEVEATKAERESIKQYQAWWVEAHIGEEYDGRICAVTEFGLFVRLPNGCEGLVHVATLGGDYWQFDEKNYRLIGEASGETYTLGDEVHVVVVKSDANRGTVDFRMV